MEGAAGAFGAALGFTLFKFLQMAGRRFPTILGAWCGSATDMNSYNALMAWLGPWCCSRGHRTWCTLRRCHGAPSCDHPAIFGLILTTYRYMYNHMLYSIVTWYMFWIISYIYIYIKGSWDHMSYCMLWGISAKEPWGQPRNSDPLETSQAHHTQPCTEHVGVPTHLPSSVKLVILRGLGRGRK